MIKMLGIFILTIIFVVIITFLSFISKRIEKRILFPVTSVFIGVALFFISFTVGEWEGMRLGAMSICIFLASVLSLMTIVFLYKLNIGRDEA